MSHFLCIDTETTGQDPKKHDIIDLSVIQYIDGKKVSSFDILMTPEYTKNLSALKVNHSAPKDWNNRKSQADGCTEFVSYLVNSVFSKKDKPTIIGHNIGFDINFIVEMLAQNDYEGWSEVVNWSVQDTSTIANFLKNAGKLNIDKISLESLIKHFDIKVPKGKAHEASFDAEATWQIYNKLLELVK